MTPCPPRSVLAFGSVQRFPTLPRPRMRCPQVAAAWVPHLLAMDCLHVCACAPQANAPNIKKAAAADLTLRQKTILLHNVKESIKELVR
jgi:hypothetical protein